MRPSRRTLLVPVAGAIAALAAGCATPDRIVVSQGVEDGGDGIPRATVTWRSDLYGEYANRGDFEGDGFASNCYRQAAVGEPVPEGCLTLGAVLDETGAYRRSPWLAFTGTLLATAALAWFALRRIAWLPRVPHSGAPPSEGPRSSTPAPDLVRMMRQTDAERSSHQQAWEAGRDVRHPIPLGLGTALVTLLVLTALVGYGTTLEWAFATGVLVFFPVAIYGALVLTSVIRVAGDMYATLQRVYFLGAASLLALGIGFFGRAFSLAVRELNGIAWPV